MASASKKETPSAASQTPVPFPGPVPPPIDRPPGWWVLYLRILPALLSNSHFQCQGVSDESVLQRAATLTDEVYALGCPKDLPVS